MTRFQQVPTPCLCGSRRPLGCDQYPVPTERLSTRMVQKVRANDCRRRPETLVRRVVRAGPSDERKGVETLSEYVTFPLPLFFDRRCAPQALTHRRTDCTTPILKETGCQHMAVCARPLPTLHLLVPRARRRRSSDIDAVPCFFLSF